MCIISLVLWLTVIVIVMQRMFCIKWLLSVCRNADDSVGPP